MPSLTVNLADHELKFIRRLARHENRSAAKTAATLMHMTMRMLQREERVGIHYGPEPKLPSIKPKPHKIRIAPRMAGWTKEQRDTWILTGQEPERISNEA